MTRRPSLASLLVAAACTSVPAATTTVPAPAGPVGSGISAADLRARLHAYADDSMRGREAGTPDNIRSTEWLAAEARRIGLQPAGENGTFFQRVPLVSREVAPASSLSASGVGYELWTDYATLDVQAPSRPIDGAQVLFAGRLADTLSLAPSAAGAGRLVVVRAVPGMSIFGAMALVVRRYPEAVAVAFANQDALVQQAGQFFRRGQVTLGEGSAGAPQPRPGLLILGTRISRALTGGDADTMRPGTVGQTVRGSVGFSERVAPARNVVAVLPGTDPALRGQYVAIGAHSDHVGVRDTPVDHDSLRAYNAALQALGAADPFSAVDPAKRAAIRVNVDSLRRIRPARMDSVFNGADDDASGSVALLEIAEAWIGAQGASRPRRSVLFVWHTAEELGLLGSQHYTDNPTVPRDSIIAHINIDMIGRGSVGELVAGGPQHVELIGPRRLSTEYATLIEQVNAARTTPFRIDYSLDADGHPQNLYCRSDHWSYARYGIPIAFFSTGTHRDYHQVTDEAQYIDYDHTVRVASFLHDIAREVANRPARLVVDGPRQDPDAPCQQ